MFYRLTSSSIANLSSFILTKIKIFRKYIEMCHVVSVVLGEGRCHGVYAPKTMSGCLHEGRTRQPDAP